MAILRESEARKMELLGLCDELLQDRPLIVLSNRGPVLRQFDSGLFGKDASFSQTFDEPGEFAYFCTVHPFMKGTVKVVQGN